jgi:hypothetical protein
MHCIASESRPASRQRGTVRESGRERHARTRRGPAAPPGPRGAVRNARARKFDLKCARAGILVNDQLVDEELASRAEGRTVQQKSPCITESEEIQDL